MSATKTPAKRSKPRHSPKRVDEGLMALLATGSSYKASELTGIPAITLRDWRHRYATRLSDLAKRYGPQLEAEALASLQEGMAAAREGTLEAVELARQQIRDGDIKDPAGTARNLATVVGILTEKSLLLQGKPSQITETRPSADVMRALAQRVPGLVINGTATEIPADQHRSNGETDTAELPARCRESTSKGANSDQDSDSTL